MKLNRLTILCASAVVSVAAMAQNNIAEEVVWWIGDQPIYKSEVEEMYQNMLYERQEINGNPYCVIPERIAIEKLFLHQAELDSVNVPDGQVMSQVDKRINYFIDELGSAEKVEQYFRRPMPELRAAQAEVVRNSAMIEDVQRSLTKDIKATPSDVRKYFASLPSDSIPYVPMQVEVQILTVNPIIPNQEIEEVKSRLRDYADRVNRGESDFSTLAILYSEDPATSVRGGELGFYGRGELDPEYAGVAFNLSDPKKVSKIVKSQFGYHIIQLIEKRGDRINTRHILLRPKVSDKDLTDALNALDTLRKDILAEKFPFEAAVQELSHDKNTNKNRGIMVNSKTGTARFEMADLPQEVGKQVANMGVGEISKPFIMKDPVTNTDIVAIVKLSARIDGHRANMSDDYQLIKNMYEGARREKIISDWIEKKIKDTYVRIEPGWRDCEFKHKGWIKN